MSNSYISTLSSLVALLGAGIPFVAFLLVWIRTQSLHLPLSRLWQLILGSQEIQDPEIKRLINEQNDLMRFRLAFGIRVESMAQCRRLQDWAKTHGLEMTQLGACRAFFDIAKFDPKVPSRFFVHLRFAVLLLSLSLLLSVPELMKYGSALARLKDSGRWVLLDNDSAATFPPFGSERLTREWCWKGDPAKPLDSFNPDERGILCKAFGSEGTEASERAKAASELAAFVQDALSAQRSVLGLLAASLILCALVCARWLAAAAAVTKLKRMLGEPPSEANTAQAPVVGKRSQCGAPPHPKSM